MKAKKVTPLNRRSFLKWSAVTGVLAFFSNWLHSPFATAQETSKKLFRRVRPGEPGCSGRPAARPAAEPGRYDSK
jgi:hypothetical protein